jgi:ferric-dicitrate binding protein FerR (iron transport regulator)
MEIKKMPVNSLVKKIISDASDSSNDLNDIKASDKAMQEYKKLRKIWTEAEKTGIFERIDTDADWKRVSNRLPLANTVKYRMIPAQKRFIRIAAALVILFGLTAGLYKLITSRQEEWPDVITCNPENGIHEIRLPDGSTVTLNSGSQLIYKNDFNLQDRSVILHGEALFDVIYNPSLPFRVYIGESVVEVTGTSFTVREDNSTVKVSVLSGKVKLSLNNDNAQAVSISANQSGYLLSSKELKVEDGVPVNDLSWKTGHLVFDQTPLDSALIDIARHFRKDLSIETPIKDRITAEFQNQPLHEILDELEQVAGFAFDTTGNSLIVRK